MSDDIEETIDASPYTANRNDSGRILLWNDEERIMSLPADFPVDLVRHVAQAYAKGNAAGRQEGTIAKETEIRRVLGL